MDCSFLNASCFRAEKCTGRDCCKNVLLTQEKSRGLSANFARGEGAGGQENSKKANDFYNLSDCAGRRRGGQRDGLGERGAVGGEAWRGVDGGVEVEGGGEVGGEAQGMEVDEVERGGGAFKGGGGAFGV